MSRHATDAARAAEEAVLSVMRRSRAAWWPYAAIVRCVEVASGTDRAAARAALAALVARGAVEAEDVATGGRPATQYRLVRT